MLYLGALIVLHRIQLTGGFVDSLRIAQLDFQSIGRPVGKRGSPRPADGGSFRILSYSSRTPTEKSKSSSQSDITAKDVA
jgi:hypothetical protein